MVSFPSRASLDNLSDTSSCEDSVELSHSALRDLSVSQVQNRQSSASSDSTIDSLTSCLQNLRIDLETNEPSLVHDGSSWHGKPKNQGKRRLTRPAISANTFEVLQTVPEDELSVLKETRYYPKLPASGEKFADHPLVTIARNGIASAEEQRAKHRDGWFEAIVSTHIPIEPSNPKRDTSPELKRFHFGLTLLPSQDTTENKESKTSEPVSFTILLTPLALGEELLVGDEGPVGTMTMALAEPNHGHLAPVTESEESAADRTQQLHSASTSPVSDKEKHMETISPKPPAKPVARIEDSVEALDQLEEQLEAFDEAAHVRRIVSPVAPDMGGKSPVQSLSVITEATRSRTPQPKRTTPVKTGSSSVRIKSTSEPRRSVRKAASMIFLDSPKLKAEDKPLAQAPPKKLAAKGIASLLPPKQPPKSVRKPIIPTFELPGDEVARKLKEKREARASAQTTSEATKPTMSSLRRAKSAKAPTRPSFELPGEAISRRKREEREAQLRAQEEEERKRREFKARPVRSGAAPSTFPRETIASRARQGKLVENSGHQVSPGSNKPASMMMNSASRSPLSKTDNQTQSRGRGLHPEPFGMLPSRATSSSTAESMSGQRSSVSTEEVQQQRLRGQEIYKRDNSWTGEREREKREREALAKLAREEAAERSRQKSREWAAKQAKKRMTITSYRDVMA
ncbi:hypothetical protein GGR54DRAFT_581581 [Hypoxylon sp. NC1633]|nr:hypothetical protein GGR54DRAFT_581581 [Hypoxylon sp. NC1633]